MSNLGRRMIIRYDAEYREVRVDEISPSGKFSKLTFKPKTQNQVPLTIWLETEDITIYEILKK